MAKIDDVVNFFTDKGKQQHDAFHNSAALIPRDPRTQLKVKVDYTIDGSEVADQMIGVIRLKAGAQIEWHNIEILADTDAAGFNGEIGLVDAEGTFTSKATMGAANPVGSATVPAAHEPELEESTWIVFQIKATVPASGKVSFYIPYIALA
ncbi:hypothetical protein SAMN02745181_0532 [Rubritalea squalenifaciens DSM 18772]|uniref:Uncharacterized protein n=1 Tax=Rubritalea squalenifaciens DSM 18772 TaxID=1123071 RepID=A0A1M6CQ41_9BACT|nr:hypothetical protein [Rubritalea squalenifaciens]SHI62848.1 hypothetical protein SAMN02745181_0532 [Rubritalea squalenifaciens DSM 18772]